MKKVELKKCPFCGGEARRYYGRNDWFGVVCKKCSAKVYGYSSQASATRGWNRRTDDDEKTTERKK